MECPKEVLEAVSEILSHAILRIRNVGNQTAKYCSIEADHVHNLPSLISNYSDDLLKFYLEVERPIYLRDSLSKNFTDFEIQWKRLESFLQKQNIIE